MIRCPICANPSRSAVAPGVPMACHWYITPGGAVLIAGGDVVVHGLGPAGAGPFGVGSRQGAPDGVHDLVGDEYRVHGHRGRRARVDDGALRRDDRETTVRPLVAGNRGVEERRQREVDGRVGVGERTVLEPRDLRIGAGEVGHQFLAAHGQGDADRHVHAFETVVVAVILSRVDAVGQPGDGGAHAAVGVVQHAVEVAQVRRHAEFRGEPGHAFGADLRGAQHGPEVPVQEFGGARVDEQQLPDVVAYCARINELQYRQADALVPDLGGFRVCRCRQDRRRCRTGGRGCSRTPRRRGHRRRRPRRRRSAGR